MLERITLAAFSCLLVYFIWFFLKRSKLPRGPKGLPLLGYLPFLGKDHHLTLETLATKYGGVYSLQLGLENVVVLSDWQSIKQALSSPDLLGRPQSQFGTFFDDIKGHEMIDGPEWKSQRRICQKILHNNGFRVKTMEDEIKSEMNFLFAEIEKRVGQPMDIGEYLAASITNNIAYILFGHRYDYEDPVRKRLNDVIHMFFQDQKMLSSLNFYKSLVKIVLSLKPPQVKKFFEGVDFLKDLTNEEIRVHQSGRKTETTEDFIDGCLAEREKGAKLSDQTILGNVLALLGGGSDTVLVAVKWLLLFSVAKPDIQLKVQEEIDCLTGGNRTIEYADRALMAFTQAVILETLRWASIVPINVLRRATQDIYVGEYFIPENTTVVCNIWAAHMDKTVWKNPEQFDPTRWIDDENQLKKMEAFIPFSMGKRTCTAEAFARCEVFLFYTMILQKYFVSIPKGVKISLKRILTMTMVPEQQPVFVFTNRK